jgi:7-carboxy-7-deazaguanine synthase
MTMKYPIAPSGIFWSIQGEGALVGEPMVFVRLAGCSIGCPLCDTNYSVAERLSVREIVARVSDLSGVSSWVWITGGEPTDHDLAPLMAGLSKWRIAIATAGHRPNGFHPSFTSVSPHDPEKWVLKGGSEVKIVPGLNGFRIADFSRHFEGMRFDHRWVQPCDGDDESLNECLSWVRSNPGWRVSPQAHKTWSLQ